MHRNLAHRVFMLRTIKHHSLCKPQAANRTCPAAHQGNHKKSAKTIGKEDGVNHGGEETGNHDKSNATKSANDK